MYKNFAYKTKLKEKKRFCSIKIIQLKFSFIKYGYVFFIKMIITLMDNIIFLI